TWNAENPHRWMPLSGPHEADQPQRPRGTFDWAIGGVYGVEVTHGANGWHIHRHEVLAFACDLSTSERRRFEGRAAVWWAECVAKALGESRRPTWRRGLRVDVLHDARYIAKLGLEVADVGIKRSSHNRTQWDLLYEAAEGDAEALDLAADYVRSMRGRKAVQFSERLMSTWQRWGWRSVPDEELAAGPAGAPLALEVPDPSWLAIRASSAVCEALDLEELRDVQRKLVELGPEWRGGQHWGNGRRVRLDAAKNDQARERRALTAGVTKADVRRTLAIARDRWWLSWYPHH